MARPVSFARAAAIAVALVSTLAAAGPRIDSRPLPAPPVRWTAADLQITGRVVDATSGRTLESAQVFVPALRTVGVLTGRDGRYLLTIPEAQVTGDSITVRVELIGYSAQTAVVHPSDVASHGAIELDFRLNSTALRLQELVVTGVAGEQPRTRTPVRVESVNVSASDASAAGAPATPTGQILLRGPTTISAPPNREQYARIVENEFRSAFDVPLSTFSIDVDRASYSNIRRFVLREGQRPPVDAVQVEEMINYFPYDYELPAGDDPVAITTELGLAPWREGHRILRIGLASRPIDTEDLPPANFVFLLDTSGSMSSPDKLPLVKRALRLLVNELREDDRVAIVTYAGSAGLVLESTSGADREHILDALDRLESGGSTAGGAGLRLAYDVARRNFVRGGNNRVILATDGDFNVGESSDAAMTRLVEERREQGTFLSVLGFGTGNLQSEKMQQIAQNGNGNYAYIDGLEEARKVLVEEMGGTLLTVAKDVKVQVEFNPARVRAYRLIGYENRLLADEDFNDDTKDAGELGAGHTVTALYEIVPVGSDSDVGGAGVDPLRYREPDPREGVTDSDELAFVKVRYKDPDGTESRLISEAVDARPDRSPSVDFRFATAVAGFGMILSESEHVGSFDAEQVLEWAHDGLGRDRDGYRRGFLDLVRAWQRIEGGRHHHRR